MNSYGAGQNGNAGFRLTSARTARQNATDVFDGAKWDSQKLLEIGFCTGVPFCPTVAYATTEKET